MDPPILPFLHDPPDSPLLESVVDHLEEGGLVAVPTETVYGFGCLAEPAPLAELLRLKGRGPEKPFLVLIPGAEAVASLSWTDPARELARVFWPGALTLILNDPQGSFPAGVRSREGTVAVRVTPQPLARRLVEALDRPLVSTSANLPGEPPALDARQARDSARILGAGSSLWVLDGGVLEPSDPSTLVDCTGPRPTVLRPGAIPLYRLRCVLPEIHEPT